MTSDSTLIHDAELPADSTDAPDEWVELGRTAGAYGFKGALRRSLPERYLSTLAIGSWWIQPASVRQCASRDCADTAQD